MNNPETAAARLTRLLIAEKELAYVNADRARELEEVLLVLLEAFDEGVLTIEHYYGNEEVLGALLKAQRLLNYDGTKIDEYYP